MHSFIHSLLHSLIHSFVHSLKVFTRLLLRSHIHPCIDKYMRSFINSLARSVVPSFHVIACGMVPSFHFIRFGFNPFHYASWNHWNHLIDSFRHDSFYALTSMAAFVVCYLHSFSFAHAVHSLCLCAPFHSVIRTCVNVQANVQIDTYLQIYEHSCTTYICISVYIYIYT